MSRIATSSRAALLAIVCLLILGIGVGGCSKQTGSPQTSDNPGGAAAGSQKPAGALEVTFTYGSEKKAWISKVTDDFNAANHTIASGQRIWITAIPEGSGDCIDELISGARQTDLVSPASGAFVTLGNAESVAKTGGDLIGPTQNLVLSPVVVAMWKPMAEALGWGKKPIGWSDIIAISQNPQGWAAYGHPEWGRFKFGHTHPDFSNSGLITSLAVVYAATGKVSNLTLDDVTNPATGKFMSEVEASVQHYGSSTGFFADKLEAGGPSYLSAAVLYESLVCDSYKQKDSLPFPLVAIYPKEGTFWSDHPIGIVHRPWVTDEKKEAAKVFTDYLMARPQQEAALTFGFRPGDPTVPLGAPITSDFGVDPAEPKTTLAVPSADVMNAILQLWHQHKKAANIVLILDTSGSMNDDNKLTNAKAGAIQLMDQLEPADTISLLPFSNELRWSGQGLSIATQRDAAKNVIQGLIADGGTRLYDSVYAAVQYLQANPTPDKISAVVVLTDGADNQSAIKFDDLVSRITFNGEKQSIRVFTIGYGKDADEGILKKIADCTKASYYKGTPQNIRDVFRDIATFF
jgi:Ca-activated chloride channel family protein